MELKKVIASVATAAMLSLPAFAAPQNPGDFSALQGMETQALTAEEMQAITGELNAYDIAAALLAKAATLDAFPRLQAAIVSLANYYLANASAINALFAKYGVLTPCTSSLCP
jgi:hypothetical protein